MIHVRQLTKHYEDLRQGFIVALAGISFDALPGQIFGLLGPNGAGKTTTLRILSTMLRPTSGTATVNGCDVVAQADLVRHQIGYMSASTGIYDRMTAWEMVEHFGLLYGLTPERLRERMEDLFHRLKMNEIRDVMGAKMSTGMRQKVSIARTLVHDPPVLIFDDALFQLPVRQRSAHVRAKVVDRVVRAAVVEDAHHLFPHDVRRALTLGDIAELRHCHEFRC
jgi:sodium transport system ATP-binding protein